MLQKLKTLKINYMHTTNNEEALAKFMLADYKPGRAAKTLSNTINVAEKYVDGKRMLLVSQGTGFGLCLKIKRTYRVLVFDYRGGFAVHLL